MTELPYVGKSIPFFVITKQGMGLWCEWPNP